MTADSLPHTDLTTRKQNLANLHCRHNQLEIFPLCLDFPSACWLFWCPPQSALSWITLPMCALGTLTPMDLRNLLCFLYLFQLKPSLVRNAELCSLEIAGLSMLAAWSSLSLVLSDDLFSSLRCCLIESSAELPGTSCLIFAMSFDLFSRSGDIAKRGQQSFCRLQADL